MNQLIMDESEKKPTFQKLQLVWAKILGWPWWPARITQIPSGKFGNYKVQFFADTSHAFLTEEKLVHYQQGRQRYSNPKGHYRNFTKALGQADKLLQSIVNPSDDLQSLTAQRDKLVVQQNQIINNKQQVQKVSTDKNQNAQQQLRDQNEVLSQPKVKRRHVKANRMHRRSKSQTNKQSIQQLQAEVQALLKKYKLESIIEQKPRKFQNRIFRKAKIALKNFPEHLNRTQIEMRMARKINKSLALKDIEFGQRFQIATTLVSTYFKCKENQDLKVKGIHRALFQWIKTHDSQTIQKDYKYWPFELDGTTLNIT